MTNRLPKDTRLVEIDGTWVLLHNDQEYVRLIDAQSRDEAEQQIAEMILIRDWGHANVDSEEDHPPPMATSGPTQS